MATALDLIKSALRKINSYQSGEQISTEEANDALEVLNDMLDSWSTEKAFIYAAIEVLFTFSANQFKYSIGPGADFDTSRPLRITSAYTRFSGLDFLIDVGLDEERYNSILLKNQPAPWPLVLWYNPTYPLGTLNFYPAPSDNGELHLFTTQIFTTFTSLTQSVNLPQGYARAIKWGLARELCAEYGMEMTEAVKVNGMDAISKVKSLNQIPAVVSRLDDMLPRGNKTDASWILTGGFR